MLAATSFLSPRHARRAALVLYLVSFALIIAALMFGAEVKGSRRWILGLQPSEFIKPAFVILAAWAFTEGGRRDAPRGLGARVVDPDPAGDHRAADPRARFRPDHADFRGLGHRCSSWRGCTGSGSSACSAPAASADCSPTNFRRTFTTASSTSSTRTSVAGGVSDTFQVDTALQAILSGGWFGRGPGEGVFKRILPDAHTDFVFAVAGEEFGILACLGLIAFFGFIVMRGLWLASRNCDPFSRAAAAGLTIMFGVQSWINIAVNLRAIPAKGMTLPFISYGGSSEIALAIGMGFLVALTRSNLAAPSVLDRA